MIDYYNTNHNFPTNKHIYSVPQINIHGWRYIVEAKNSFSISKGVNSLHKDSILSISLDSKGKMKSHLCYKTDENNTEIKILIDKKIAPIEQQSSLK